MSLLHRIEELQRILEDTDGFPAAHSLVDATHNSSIGPGISFWSLIEALPVKPKDSASDPFSQSMQTDASHETVSQSLRAMIQQLRSLDQANQCPIVAITGLLNAGKSSLLATFLSPEGRKRVLIGQANDQGTHRFILWMPESWKRDPGVWSMVLGQLTNIFGSPPELLSDDPSEAREQYNGRVLHHGQHESSGHLDSLAIPLIATDTALDRWGIALMDCPDVQTGLWFEGESNSNAQEMDKLTVAEQSIYRADHRAQMLIQSMRLCSAFLLVAPANGLHDQLVLNMLSAMRSKMPGVERIIVVNRVPRKYECREIRDEVKERLSLHEVGRVYMAYHFEGPLQRERLPAPPPNANFNEAMPLPVFLRIDGESVPQPPNEFDPSLYLTSLGSQIDRGKLMIDCRSTLAVQIESELVQAWKDIHEDAQQRQKKLRRVWQVIADACSEFSRAETGDSKEPLRLHASRKIVDQISESLERTAPWWAKPSRWIVRAAKATKETVAQTTKSVMPLNWLSTKSQGVVDLVQGKFRRGEIGKVVSATRLVQHLEHFDYHRDLHGSDDVKKLEGRCQTIIDRFQAESETQLDDKTLDEFTTQVWAQMGWKQRMWTGLVPATLAFGPLLAVIALPFDFGGSSVLVLASMKELLFAGMAGMGIVLANRDNMPKVAEQEAAWQQLSDLFAIGCDEMGLPRPADSLPSLVVGGESKRLLPAAIASSRSREPVIPLPIQVRSNFWPRVERQLKQLSEEASQ